MKNENRPFFKIWLTAIRPFALPASTIPVVFGSALAVIIRKSGFNAPLFLLALASMITLHSGANILSDVNDYRRGLDISPTPASGAIVRGYIDARTALKGALTLLAVGCIAGAVIAIFVGLPVLFIGVAGVTVGVFYTVRPVTLKYRALGDLAVFIDFGLLGTLGAWTVQTGSISWVPVLWSVPVSLLIVAIVHANNWRDIQTDEEKKITTFAALLGDRGSGIYYEMLLFGAFAIIVILIILSSVLKLFTPAMPITFLITLAALPHAVRLVLSSRSLDAYGRRVPPEALDAGTSRLSLHFGILCIASLLIHGALTKIF